MFRNLPILMIAAVIQAWCATPAHATCGDYLHAVSEQRDGDRSEPFTEEVAALKERNDGNSCEDAPGCPAQLPAPVSVPSVINVAALCSGAPLFSLDQWRWCRSGDEIAANELFCRIDRPPRVCRR